MKQDAIHQIVLMIPPGRVASYGQIARLAGCGARQAGYALAGLPAQTDIPWHRVVNAAGRVSLPGAAGARQRALLAAEGVAFSPAGIIDLRIYGWPGPPPAGKLARSRGRK